MGILGCIRRFISTRNSPGAQLAHGLPEFVVATVDARLYNLRRCAEKLTGHFDVAGGPMGGLS